MKITQAMIMAAGEGTRMRPLTEHLPKPLIALNSGKRLLDYAIEMFQNIGCRKIVVNAFYLKEKMVEYVTTNYPNIEISEEQEKIETGGGLLYALPRFNDSNPLFCFNSDSILPFKEEYTKLCSEMEKAFEESDADMVLAVQNIEEIEVMDGRNNGDFILKENGDMILGKLLPEKERTKARHIFIGLQIIHPRIFNKFANELNFTTNKCFSLGKFYALPGVKIKGVPFHGKVFHVGSKSELDQTNERLFQ